MLTVGMPLEMPPEMIKWNIKHLSDALRKHTESHPDVGCGFFVFIESI